MKNNKYIVVLLFILLLTACSSKPDVQESISETSNVTENQIFTETLFINGEQVEVEVLKNLEKINIEYRDRLFILDESQYDELKTENSLLLTYDGSIIENYSEDNIESYMEFANFYQVNMADGQSYQLFDRPNVDFEPISSEGSQDIVAVHKHGDHYHIQLVDGSEYISYDDPRKIDSSLTIEEYEGEHGDHEGHGHEEHQHDDEQTEHNNEKEDSNSLSFIPVVKIEDIKDKDIVEISLHGDHYHLKDSENNQYLTYDDPSEYFDVEVMDYEGEH